MLGSSACSDHNAFTGLSRADRVPRKNENHAAPRVLRPQCLTPPTARCRARSLDELVRAREARLEMLVGRDLLTRLDALACHALAVLCPARSSGPHPAAQEERRERQGSAVPGEIDETGTHVLREAVGEGWLNQAMEKRSGTPSAGSGVGRTTCARKSLSAPTQLGGGSRWGQAHAVQGGLEVCAGPNCSREDVSLVETTATMRRQTHAQSRRRCS